MTIQIIGLIGAVITLLAYILISLGKLNNYNISFHLLNFIGAGLMSILAFHTDAWAIFGLDVVWMLIAFFRIGWLINI